MVFVCGYAVDVVFGCAKYCPVESDGLGCARTLYMASRSIIVNTIGSATTIERPVSSSLPNDGFNPYIPQNEAGMQILPPPSPRVNATKPAATAHFEPEEEPPG